MSFVFYVFIYRGTNAVNCTKCELLTARLTYNALDGFHRTRCEFVWFVRKIRVNYSTVRVTGGLTVLVTILCLCTTTSDFVVFSKKYRLQKFLLKNSFCFIFLSHLYMNSIQQFIVYQVICVLSIHITRYECCKLY